MKRIVCWVVVVFLLLSLTDLPVLAQQHLPSLSTVVQSPPSVGPGQATTGIPERSTSPQRSAPQGSAGLSTGRFDNAPAGRPSTVVRGGTPLATWTLRAASPVATMDNVVVWAVNDGGLWSIGGYDDTYLAPTCATQRYDPTTNTWATYAAEPAPCIEYAIDGCYGLNASRQEVVVLFPDSTGTVSGVLHRYNITTNSWDTPATPAGFPAAGIWSMDIVSLYNDTGQNVCYLSGGATVDGGGDLTDLWEYHPDTNTIIHRGNYTHIPAGFDFHASWYVPWVGASGGICVAGGTDSLGYVYDETQCYDIAALNFNAPNIDLGLLPEPWWGMADGWTVYNGDHQLWLADGVNAAGSLLQASAFFGRDSCAFAYGPAPAVALYRLEGDAWNQQFYVEQGSTGNWTGTTYNQYLDPSVSLVELLREDFESWPPAGWTIVDNYGYGCVWESNATTGLSNYAGGDGYCADADTYYWCSDMDTELRTPPIDLSSYATAQLRFVASFEYYGDYDYATVDISTDGGGSWNNLLYWTVSHGPDEVVTVDLTPYVGSTNTVIRFHYVGWYDYWFEVDQVAVLVPGTPPAAPPLAPDLVPVASTQQGCPGDSMTHVFSVMNRSGQNDSVTINCSGATWSTSCPASVGPMAVCARRTFAVTSAIPADTPPGTCDTATVQATAVSSGLNDTSTAQTCVQSGPHWEEVATPPSVAMDHVAVSYGGRMYLVGGYDAHGHVSIFDPASNSWSEGAFEPIPRIDYPVDGCFGYNAGGQPVVVLFPDTTGTVSGVLHRYNIAANSWDTPPTPAGFPAAGLWAMDILSMAEEGGGNVCYLSGGATVSGGGDQTTLWEYRPNTNTIINRGNFTHHPAGFDFHASWYAPWIGTSGAVCVGGGVDSSSVAFADTQCYDIATGTFQAPNADLGVMLQAVWGSADMWLLADGDYLLWVANGADAAFALWNGSMYYNSADGLWHAGPAPVRGTYRLEGTNAAGRIYALAGSTGGFAANKYNQRYAAPCPVPEAVRMLSFQARPAAGGVLVSWETASEHGNAGFNLYRSVVPDDPGTQLNVALIPSRSPGGDQGATYDWLDPTAAPGVTYYYTLEDVDVHGVRTPHGPVALTLWWVYLPVVAR